MANNRQAVGRDKQPRYRQDCHRYDPCVTQPLVRSAAGSPPNWKGADDQGGHCGQKMKLNNQQRDWTRGQGHGLDLSVWQLGLDCLCLRNALRMTNAAYVT